MIDRKLDLEPAVLLIGVDVVELVHVLECARDSRHPGLELVERVGLDRVLILGIRLAATLPRPAHALKEKACPDDLRELGLQPPGNLVGAHLAHCERFQLNEQVSRIRGATAARAAAASATAGKAHDILYCG